MVSITYMNNKVHFQSMAIIDNEWQEFLKQNREFSVMTPAIPSVSEDEEKEEEGEDDDDDGDEGE